MISPNSSDNDFIAKLTEIVEANLTNPQFGVSTLAKELGMSRSNLHRKVNEVTKITVSQFINQVRLKKAKEILRHTTNTVSEVAYEVGFSNVSYFIKCFHQYYGYSPGEIGNHEERTEELNELGQRKIKLKTVIISLISFVVIVVAFILVFKPLQFQQINLEKTIAILPAQNWETADSIAIDAILQNVADNLCKINDIKVIPWISVLQYRNSLKPAPEIAKKLGVSYLAKPMVRLIDSKIYLSITLIEGKRDKTLGIPVYEIDSTNITTIHRQILKDIADEIDISITPSEQVNIDKLITSNKNASEYYWEGVEILNRWRLGLNAELEDAKTCFENVLKYDNQCAWAYAQLAIIYWFMDYSRNELLSTGYKILYGKEINKYADKAMYYYSQLDLSLIAKAVYYINEQDYEPAISYLKDALSYNPNSYLAIRNLCLIYDILGDNEKFIEYALKVIDQNFPVIENYKELGKESIYFILGIKYRGLGFFEKARMYLNLAIETNPRNLYAKNEMSQVICDLEEEDNYQQSIDLLLDIINNDSTALGYYFLGLSYYMLRDYQNANIYYKKWFELTEQSVEDYKGLASGRIAIVFKEMGEPEKANVLINNYRDFAETRTDSGAYNYFYTGYYSFLGDTAKAIEHMRLILKTDMVFFRIRLLNDAPLYDNIRHMSEFQQILSDMKYRWQVKHDSIKVEFKKKGLL